MPIILTKRFRSSSEIFSEFISQLHLDVLQIHDKYHGGLGVIRMEEYPWRWCTIAVESNCAKGIEIALCLENLWVFGYRSMVSEEIITPWILTDKYQDNIGFSGLEELIFQRSLQFSGNYKESLAKMSINRHGFMHYVINLYNYGVKLTKKKARIPTTDEIATAEKQFLFMVLFFAESLRFRSIRQRLVDGFDLNLPISVENETLKLARKWRSISDSFLKTRMNEAYVREQLFLVLWSEGEVYNIDGMRPVEPEVEPEGTSITPDEEGTSINGVTPDEFEPKDADIDRARQDGVESDQ